MTTAQGGPVRAGTSGAGETGACQGTLPPPLPAYTEGAGSYERRTVKYQGWRRYAVDLLPAGPGDRVLDVGCGTGLCFPLVEAKIGSSGSIVGIDASREMLALAGRRAAAAGWPNIDLVAAPVEQAEIPLTADAALFCAVHDVLQSPAALANVFAHLRPGAWVSAAGGKWAPPWMYALNLAVYALHWPYVRDFAGFDRPWRLLERHLDQFTVREVATGSGFVAIGRARGEAGAAATDGPVPTRPPTRR
jgi:ubiquinone/menaquinone biosynthesis C-methylase UbiE